MTRAEHHPPEPHTQFAAPAPVTPQGSKPLVSWDAPSGNSDRPGLWTRQGTREPRQEPCLLPQSRRSRIRIRTVLTTPSWATPGKAPTSVMGDLGFTFLAAAISWSWLTSSVMDSRSSGLTFSVAPTAEAGELGPGSGDSSAHSPRAHRPRKPLGSLTPLILQVNE